MKKKQYIAAVACLVAGIIGFGSVYATEKAEQKKQEARQIALQQEQEEAQNVQETQEEEEPAASASSVVEPRTDELPKDVVEMDVDRMTEDVPKEVTPSAQQEEDGQEEVQPTAVVEDALHFTQSEEMVWPLEGNVLLNYSMDSTIYFPTLDQYRYNPALIISGNVNDKVYLVANGRISDIYTNEETGCTVKQDLGDGYTAIYGQLKELNFEVGDMVEGGQVIGYVSEPTKYYSTEGSNLYFELQKDGVPVNPLDYFE